MYHYSITLIGFIAPILFTITAIYSWFQPGNRPIAVKKLSIVSALTSIVLSIFLGFLVFSNGLIETPFLGIKNIGISLRYDALSILMFGMIALLSFIIIRFSFNYLDGDNRQGIFLGRLSATIASVQLLVLSGNLGVLFIAWVLTSVFLHRLLVFYKERPGAKLAARKKFIVARLGDLSLLSASVLLFNQFNTGNLEVIFTSIKTGTIVFNHIGLIGFLLITAALLKSAQFPFHVWLLEVMETPTPVSALLHAGLLNAGPFLIVRMAFVMQASNVHLILVIVGGLTALFGSIVYLTQTSVKTALGFSSIAHMGFSLMVCGLGLYPAAMLHLVAHSFYKAHAFLSTGSAIDAIRNSRILGAQRKANPMRIGMSIMFALTLYLGFAYLWGINPEKDFSLLAIGAVIVFGISRILSSAIDSNSSFKLMIQSGFVSLIVVALFFSLETAAHHLLSYQLPELGQTGIYKNVIIFSIISVFGMVVFLQIISPVFQTSTFYRAIYIHFRNGLYINVVFDRMVRALYLNSPAESKSEILETINENRINNPIEILSYKTQRA
ncbi:MAG: hypothetical protein KDD29_00410 [Flavobacteriales bacterium]|nr:hypothetical protein [Flavobacteriales bacterium]MCB9336223.1 NADH/ubiquinone/plastoquinone (complex i) [Flavobacteriales bacterium]